MAVEVNYHFVGFIFFFIKFSSFFSCCCLRKTRCYQNLLLAMLIPNTITCALERNGRILLVTNKLRSYRSNNNLFEKKTEPRLYPRRPQPDRHPPLPLKITYTNIVMLFLCGCQSLCDFKTCTILVYMILIGKGSYMVVVYMGSVLVPSFLTGQSNIARWTFLNKTFLLLFQVLVCLFCSF